MAGLHFSSFVPIVFKMWSPVGALWCLSILGSTLGTDEHFKMFESPEKYARLAGDHMKEAQSILNRFGKLVKGGDGETVLDVGCGTANVTVSVLGSFRKWKKVVGLDFNKAMIDYDRAAYQDKRFSFKLGNFNQPIDPDRIGTYDKIFSFFALQWMDNREVVAQNIFKLLKPGGQAFLVIVAHSSVFEAWDNLALTSKWQKYVKLSRPLNDLVYLEEADKEYENALTNAGLIITKNKLYLRKNIFRALENTDESKIEKLLSVDPFYRHIPEKRREEYVQDLLKEVKQQAGEDGATDYTALLIIAQKPAPLQSKLDTIKSRFASVRRHILF